MGTPGRKRHQHASGGGDGSTSSTHAPAEAGSSGSTPGSVCSTDQTSKSHQRFHDNNDQPSTSASACATRGSSPSATSSRSSSSSSAQICMSKRVKHLHRCSKRQRCESPANASCDSSVSASSSTTDANELLHVPALLDAHLPTVEHEPRLHPDLQRVDSVPTLLDLAAKIAAENISFHDIESSFAPVPEPVQRRIIFWSFSRSESHIERYSAPPSGRLKPAATNPLHSTAGGSSGSSSNVMALQSASSASTGDFQEPSSYSEGLRLIDNGCVEDALQIGFYLSGTVRSLTVIDGDRKAFNVSLTFDRCKITSVKCTCEQRDNIYWCQHVVALAVFRIRCPDKVKLCLPISETIYQMSHQQLQKFVQYVIADHYTEVLPTCQAYADQILDCTSHIAQTRGAPDPTAGTNSAYENRWHLDDSQVRSLVSQYLCHQASMDQVYTLFAKVREMLSESDCNGPRLLTILSEQFLNTTWVGSLKSQTPYQPQQLSEKCQQLWDQLGALWVCVVLNPYATAHRRSDWELLLRRWSAMPSCAPEVLASNTSYGSTSRSHSRQQQQQRTVFSRALDVCHVSWSDEHLQRIMDKPNAPPVLLDFDRSQIKYFDHRGYALWEEKLHISCARIDTLRAHGRYRQALNLAIAVVHTLQYWQEEAQRCTQSSSKSAGCIASCSSSKPEHAASSEHSANPMRNSIENVFGMSVPLQEIVSSSGKKHRDGSSSKRSKHSTTGSGSSSEVREELEHPLMWIGHPLDPINCLYDTLMKGIELYTHHPSGRESTVDFQSLALEAALIALGSQRPLPQSQYLRQKAMNQEEKLIAKLRKLANPTVPTKLMAVILKQARMLVEGGSWSGLSKSSGVDRYPMHTFACYLFQVLLPVDKDLAFRVALRAMRQSVGNEDNDDSLILAPTMMVTLNFTHLENQQSNLAVCLFTSAKEELIRQSQVLTAVKEHMTSSTLLHQLSINVKNSAELEADQSVARINLINSAHQLGLQVLKMTVGVPNWHRDKMVNWSVGCAVSNGLEAVLQILKQWETYFTPLEAVCKVAKAIISEPKLSQQLKQSSQKEKLSSAIRMVAFDCVKRNPHNCAIQALTLCEGDNTFEMVYRVIYQAAQYGCLPPQEIFSIAKHMEVKCHALRAFDLAKCGLTNTHVGYNEDNSALIADVYWSCALGHSLGKKQLTEVIAYIVRNVKCATVLSDILRRCSYSSAAQALSTPFTLSDAQTSTSGRKLSQQDGNTTAGQLAFQHQPPCFMGPIGPQSQLGLTNPSIISDPHHHTEQPLRQLLEAAILAYVNTTHSRLTHISPRHYGEFIDFLTKARETFCMASDGNTHFAQLIENMKLLYKGKKKLISLIQERFG